MYSLQRHHHHDHHQYNDVRFLGDQLNHERHDQFGHLDYGILRTTSMKNLLSFRSFLLFV